MEAAQVSQVQFSQNNVTRFAKILATFAMGFAAMKDGYGAENRCSIAQFRVSNSRLALKKAGNRRIAFKTVPKKRGIQICPQRLGDS